MRNSALHYNCYMCICTDVHMIMRRRKNYINLVGIHTQFFQWLQRPEEKISHACIYLPLCYYDGIPFYTSPNSFPYRHTYTKSPRYRQRNSNLSLGLCLPLSHLILFSEQAPALEYPRHPTASGNRGKGSRIAE